MINIRNARQYIENFLMIRTKEGKLVRLKMNKPQRRLYETIARQKKAGKPVRVVILKARQMGFSTVTEALIFWATATARYTDSLILAHTEEATGNLFRMSKMFYDCLPRPIRPMLAASNAQELRFDKPSGAPEGVSGLNSRIRCATAGGQGVGRSYTLKNVHMSEFAFWPGDKTATFTGIMQAVPDTPDSMVIVESTANGYDAFKDLWDESVAAWEKGETDGFIPVFFPWYEMDEYTREPPVGFTLTAEEREIKERFGLADGQMYWRRWCIRVNCNGDLNLFHQEYPATPEEAFLSTGQCVFDKEQVAMRRAQVSGRQYEKGFFRYTVHELAERKLQDIEWVPDENGVVRIFRHPQDGVPFVLGGDTAGTGSDKFTGQMLDNTTGAQVAVLQHQFDETMYARQMYCLGMYYNEALIGVETNYSTYPVKELERLGYRNLYVRQREDTYTGQITKSYGVDTNSTTRPLMIDGLKEVARRDIDLICDWETLSEMLSFVYDDNWKPQAEVGKHDDLVMALAIAHYIRPQQSYTAMEPEGRKVQWTEDMLEDYRAASPEEKKMLLQMWGTPQSG